MNKKLHLIIIAAVAALMTACNSDSDLPLTHPDGYGEIQFSIGSGSIPAVTRAGEGTPGLTYVPYDSIRDPRTMGVFGWYELDGTTFSKAANRMFNNVSNTAHYDVGADVTVWEYEGKKYWIDYLEKSPFDFFGYMPYNENVTIATTDNDDEYKLTMPVEFPDGATFSPVETALLCAKPIHKVQPEGTIPFYMDQTLTGYTLVFQLGEKMDSIRDFMIKDVKVYGESLAYKGDVSRTYTWEGLDWEAGNITWANVDTKDVDVADAVSVPYLNNGGDSIPEYYIDPTIETDLAPAMPGMLRVTNHPVQWGTPIYVIPTDEFAPVFEVTYDVVVQNEENADVVTRKNIKSTISFSSTYFQAFTKGRMGDTHKIRVKIVPDHLYVLADADQTFGYIPLND
ncbi:MAG: hypothetical protein II844_00645 [Prevotella sp.]|nr:hypothetical protein [Prevotella sp.]